MKNRSIDVKGAKISIAMRLEQDYISLTDPQDHTMKFESFKAVNVDIVIRV